MLKISGSLIFLLATIFCAGLAADDPPLKEYCAQCHSGSNPEAGLDLTSLRADATASDISIWEKSLQHVLAGEMPPSDAPPLKQADKTKLVSHLRGSIERYHLAHEIALSKPRRLNNREFRNAIRDALMIEDVGTHLPTSNLLGDSLHHGFDTHADTLGFSRFHLEQYVLSIRKIVDAAIFSHTQPSTRSYQFGPTKIVEAQTSQNTKRPERRGSQTGFDFLDPRRMAYLDGFSKVQSTGRYRITIQCVGKDRGVYDSSETGIYDGDPIQLKVLMGDRTRTFDLPDEKVVTLELNEWLAAGTRLRFQHPTDGLRMRGNGNFKFQNSITGEHLKLHNPELYGKVVGNLKPTRAGKIRKPLDWHNWVDYWQGPRPRLLKVTLEGPTFESWPPNRQVRLFGAQPDARNALKILKPIAERAWRKSVDDGELAPIVNLVQAQAKQMTDVEALKEGLVAILISPNFLIQNTERLSQKERLTEKISFFLRSSIPNQELTRVVAEGKLDTYDGVLGYLKSQVKDGNVEPFLTAFPYGWLELRDINFMAPDPDQFRFYHRKNISTDMTNEVFHFFRHAVNENIPVHQLLTADYSFLNSDLATLYGVEIDESDSTFRKHQFKDGRRGGILGMGAFLTLTADSQGTSPIHRAVFVLENFMGITPTPPPANVKIEEPDIRSAKTIRQVLQAHQSDKSCAACHLSIDPYGYAFESFGPTGEWRDHYDAHGTGSKRRMNRQPTVAIDPSAKFRNGDVYADIIEFRALMSTEKYQKRFIRCFIKKLLTYANGVEPRDLPAIEDIVEVSQEHDYRIIETIAAVIDSPLFRKR